MMMTKKKVLAQLSKKIGRSNFILKPIYLYILTLGIYYFLRDYLYFEFFGFDLMVANIVIFILPIALLFYLVILFRKNKIKNIGLLFLISLIPGILFGLQLSYGLYVMGHGDDPIGAIAPFSITAGFFGVISGIVGLVINFLMSLVKKA